MRALHHAEVGPALARVRGSGAYPGAMLAFEFLVLTAARSGEVRNVRWEQVDRDGAVWTVPTERMKAGRAHRVPLSLRALEVLDGAAELFDGAGLVLPSPPGRVLNHSALTNLLHALGIDAVAHGFRSSFRDWAAECTDAPREVIGIDWKSVIGFDRNTHAGTSNLLSKALGATGLKADLAPRHYRIAPPGDRPRKAPSVASGRRPVVTGVAPQTSRPTNTTTARIIISSARVIAMPCRPGFTARRTLPPLSTAIRCTSVALPEPPARTLSKRRRR